MSAKITNFEFKNTEVGLQGSVREGLTRGKGKGKRGKGKGERRKEKGERRKEKGKRQKEKDKR